MIRASLCRVTAITRDTSQMSLSRLVGDNTIDSLDGDHIAVDDIHDPVPADPQPVIPAPVEPLRRVRIGGQSGDGYADGVHAILISQVTAR
jgi:hypothetical protein